MHSTFRDASHMVKSKTMLEDFGHQLDRAWRRTDAVPGTHSHTPASHVSGGAVRFRVMHEPASFIGLTSA
jgi:hypothetical protein